MHVVLVTPPFFAQVHSQNYKELKFTLFTFSWIFDETISWKTLFCVSRSYRLIIIFDISFILT